MADNEFQGRLRKELDDELQQFTEIEQQAARLYFNLDGGYNLNLQEVAAILKRTPDEVTLMISRIREHLQRKELIHTLPSRAQ